MNNKKFALIPISGIIIATNVAAVDCPDGTTLGTDCFDCGSECRAYLTDDLNEGGNKQLNIIGTETYQTYRYGSWGKWTGVNVPWRTWGNQVTSLVIDDEMTNIGPSVFSYLTNVSHLSANASNLSEFLNKGGAFASGDVEINCTSGACSDTLKTKFGNNYDASRFTVIGHPYTIENEDGTVSTYVDDQLRQISHADGSIYIYDENRNVIGIKGKRIFTIEEAETLSKKTGNTFKLRYR
ncbi:MAG: hypothetical protein IJ870_01905 [Alphaproteobacteria bacterium]|nr:hypothetical protein [Alphaproteobacteria bacterium]